MPDQAIPITTLASNWGILPGYASEAADKNDAWKSNVGNMEAIMGNGVRMLGDDPVTRRLVYWKKFDRLYTIDRELENPSARHYVFMLRPDLNLLDTESGDGAFDSNSYTSLLSAKSYASYDPYFQYLAKFHPEIISSLCQDNGGFSAAPSNLDNTANLVDGDTIDYSSTINDIPLASHNFIPYITSRVESLQLPDFAVKDNILQQPYTHYAIPYAQASLEQLSGQTFDIGFRDDKYYSLHKLFYAWIYYMNKVSRNEFSPKDKYVLYNAIDYATSIYDFLVDETGENIIYWAKFTGAIPTNVPLSNLSFNKGNLQNDSKLQISFKYFYAEHMDLDILRDFNFNSLGHEYMVALKQAGRQMEELVPCDISQTEPIYNQNFNTILNLVGRPIIIFRQVGSEPQICLRWMKDNETSFTPTAAPPEEENAGGTENGSSSLNDTLTAIAEEKNTTNAGLTSPSIFPDIDMLKNNWTWAQNNVIATLNEEAAAANSATPPEPTPEPEGSSGS